MKKFLTSMLILSLSFSLIACQTKSKTEDSQDTAKEQADVAKRSADELVLAVGETFSGDFDPKKMYDAFRVTHQSLLKYQPDLSIDGDLAKDYKISEDKKQWILTLKEDQKFSNGDLVTSEDVVFTYEMLKEDGIVFDLSGLEKAEAKENQVIFYLTKPDITFLTYQINIPIVPAQSYNDEYSENPIGSGPYVVKDYKKNEQVILEKNPHYDKPLAFNQLTFLYLEEDVALAAARAGTVDVVYVSPKYANEDIKGMHLEVVPTIEAKGISLPTVGAGNKGFTNGDAVDVGNDITSDIAIRRALNIGLNRQEIIDLAMNGYGKVVYSLGDWSEWFNDINIVKDGDLEAAKKILADGGWEDTDGDGIVEKDGKKASFKIMYPSTDKLREAIVLAIADQTSEFGIEVEVSASSWDEIMPNMKVNSILWTDGELDSVPLYRNYYGKRIDVGSNNITNYKNDYVDDCFDKAMNSNSIEEANAFWKAAQWDPETKTGFSGVADAPFVWLVDVDHLYFVADDVSIGEQLIHNHGYPWTLFNNLELWKTK